VNAAQMITAIEYVEVTPSYDAQTRSIMRDERYSLIAAVHSGAANEIKEAMEECERVAKMWGVALGS